MPNLETTYMGLKLRNPIIVASSGLTKSVGKIEACEEAGAGAVVIKSLFEESLANEDLGLDNAAVMHTEAYDYMRAEVNLQYAPKEYSDVISGAKKKVNIPVIASINCVSGKWWPDFAKRIEHAGADGLELNVYPMVNDETLSSAVIEQQYFEILEKVKQAVNIPVAMKISMFITALPHLATQLSKKGLNGLVMFNRFVEPDIDIHDMKLKSTFPFTDGDDLQHVLRWTALLSGKLDSDISATTGIHTGEGIIKLLLAGASTVQLASVLYKQGFKKIPELLDEIAAWMEDQEFNSIKDFRGKLRFDKTASPDLYLRSQFMERLRTVE